MDDTEIQNDRMDIRWEMLEVTISRLDPLSTDRGVLFRIFEDVNGLVDNLKKIEEIEANTFVSLGQLLRQLEPYLGPGRLRKLFFPALPSFSNMQDFQFNLALIRVLLEAGADPNARDVMYLYFGNNTLLHFAAAVSDRELGDAVGRLLVGYGAKIDLLNEAGKTALDIWVERNETEENWNEELGGWNARPEWCCPIPTLLNLAARVIRVRKLPCLDAPVTLHSVVELRD